MTMRPAPRRSLFDDTFWWHVADGQLHLQHCSQCDNTWYPPGPACPQCAGETWTWQPVAGTGALLSWVTFHKTYFPTMPAPYTVVTCRTDEGVLLLTDTTADPATLHIDMPMVLQHYQAVDDTGTPFTLYRWEPADTPSVGRAPAHCPGTTHCRVNPGCR
jgi:uncharacterized protein